MERFVTKTEKDTWESCCFCVSFFVLCNFINLLFSFREICGKIEYGIDIISVYENDNDLEVQHELI